MLESILSALVGALLAGIGYLIKRRFERGDNDSVDSFLDRYERLQHLADSASPPRASDEEIATAKVLVAAKRRDPLRPEASLQNEYGLQLTQLDMNRIAAAQLARSDAALEVTAMELIARWRSEDVESAFLDAIERWKIFRHAHAEAVAKSYEGGSMAPLVYSSAAEQLTQQYHEMLKKLLTTDSF